MLYKQAAAGLRERVVTTPAWLAEFMPRATCGHVPAFLPVGSRTRSHAGCLHSVLPQQRGLWGSADVWLEGSGVAQRLHGPRNFQRYGAVTLCAGSHISCREDAVGSPTISGSTWRGGTRGWVAPRTQGAGRKTAPRGSFRAAPDQTRQRISGKIPCSHALLAGACCLSKGKVSLPRSHQDSQDQGQISMDVWSKGSENRF